jgi:hypothetical protein
VFDTPTLVLEVPSDEQMLAMKVARFAGNTHIDDAKILLQRKQLRYDAVEDVWSAIGGRIPMASRDQARHNLVGLWEDLYGSA